MKYRVRYTCLHRKRIQRFITIFLMLPLMLCLLNVADVQAADATYEVKRVDSSGTLGSALFQTTNFNDAKTRMKEEAAKSANVVVTSSASKSPLKIVAADRAYLQSYPYRTGKNGAIAYATLNIFSNTSLSTAKTYIPAHYKMYYYDTFLVNGVLVAEVEIQGARGYIDIEKADFIPMIFADNNLNITLGGNESFHSTPEQPNTVRISHDIYNVASSSVGHNEISVSYSRTYSTISGTTKLTYGAAPSWLPAGTYYSVDGIHFYRDPDLKTAVMNGSQIGEYYAYFQWLPVRSMSNYTGDDLNSDLISKGRTSSVMLNSEQAFIEYGNKYGMNPLLIYAQAALESAYGESNLAIGRYNLFGWNAVDSNPDLASRYEGVEKAISDQMARQLSGYFDIPDWRNQGLSFGNKGAGVSVSYASDPFYGIKIASIAYQVDRSLGFKDHNMYSLSKINDNIAANMRKEASTTAGIWYTTRSGKINQIITNLGESNGFVKTNLSMVVMNGSVTTAVGPVNLTNEFGYMSSSLLTTVGSYGVKNATSIPTERITVSETKATYVVKQALNLRSGWSTSYRVLSVIPANTVVEGYVTSNNWVKVTYNGQTGFVSAEFLDDGSSVEPTPSPTAKLGDVNGDDNIDVLDMMAIRRHILNARVITGDTVTIADVNKDGTIDVLDMMAIRRHILGTKLIQ